MDKQKMRERLPGINSVRKRLANGKLVRYDYAWKGGPRLRGKRGSPEWFASFHEATAQKAVPARDVLLSVLAAYQQSQDFIGLAERTRRDYIAKIKLIEKRFGDFPLTALTDRRSRGVFMQWRDELAAGRQTTPGPFSLGCCHGDLTAAGSWRTPAKRAGASTAARVRTRYGPL